MSAARTELERRLAGLLGISTGDDRGYAAEVLDSLLEMGDSPDDVAEYLGSFVASEDAGGGDEDCELRRFSLDVARFNLGEKISSAATPAGRGDGIDGDGATAAAAAAATTATIDGKPRKQTRILDEAAAEREAIKRREAVARERQRDERNLAAKIRSGEDEKERLRIASEAASARNDGESGSRWGTKKTGGGMRRVRDVDSRSIVAKSEQKETAVSKEVPDPATPGAEERVAERQEAEKQRAEKQRAEMRKLRPERGTPGGKSCGCYGIKHRALANCLNCGRIACELEGVDDYCHFCGYFVEEFPPHVDTGGDAKPDANLASAMRHKERLLEFDRTSAARTHIHDDQEDYFSASTSVWSTEQEREDNRAMEESRQRKVHERKTHIMQIKF